VITLPIEAGIDLAAATQTRAQSGPPRVRRVMVVDDKPDVAETISELLDALGCEVVAAATGKAAVAAASSAAPELVLLDIGLPDMSGYEVARRMRALPGGDALKIIAISGWGQPDDIARSKAAGIDRHLVKPITLPQLREIIGELSAGAAISVR
jgi:CheY-like chemotaxis protein